MFFNKLCSSDNLPIYVGNFKDLLVQLFTSIMWYLDRFVDLTTYHNKYYLAKNLTVMNRFSLLRIEITISCYCTRNACIDCYILFNYVNSFSLLLKQYKYRFTNMLCEENVSINQSYQYQNL